MRSIKDYIKITKSLSKKKIQLLMKFSKDFDDPNFVLQPLMVELVQGQEKQACCLQETHHFTGPTTQG